jgi:PKHD-type hydroxylase
MLLRLASLLSPQEAAQLRALLRPSTWVDGRSTSGTQTSLVKNNQQLPEGSEAAAAGGKVVLMALARHAQFMTAALPSKLYPPMFNRYSGQTNALGSHVDNAVRSVALPGGGSQNIRTDLSCTVFLSDPASYDGGELVMQETGGEQRIKLNAGDAVLYPGTSVHRVEPVTRGERLASFFWVQSMVRSTEQRRLLYEMDMSITALRQQHGETDEAVRLTGCYHNLLRMWGEV